MRLHSIKCTTDRWISKALGHLTYTLILMCANVLCNRPRIEPEEYYAELQHLEEQCDKEASNSDTMHWHISQSDNDFLKDFPSLRKKLEATKEAMDEQCYNAVIRRLAVELEARARYRPAVTGEDTEEAAEAERIGRRMSLLEIDKLSHGYYKFRRESKKRQNERILEYIQQEVPVRKLFHLFYAKHPSLFPRVLSAFSKEREQKNNPSNPGTSSEAKLQGEEALQELVQEYAQLLSKIVIAQTPNESNTSPKPHSDGDTAHKQKQ